MSTSDLPPKNEGPLQLVGASLQLSGTSASIYALTQAIEQSKPLMFIDRFNLAANSSPVDENLSDTILSGEMQVFGVLRSGAGGS
jgi:Type II secretion system (T2SS), protein M subtype b